MCAWQRETEERVNECMTLLCFCHQRGEFDLVVDLVVSPGWSLGMVLLLLLVLCCCYFQMLRVESFHLYSNVVCLVLHGEVLPGGN